MASPISANLTGTLSGSTKQGALTPVPLNFLLQAQTGHYQTSIEVNAGETKVITLPTNLGGAVAAPDPQSMLVVVADVAGLDIRLNSTGVPVGPFNIVAANGMIVVPGQVGGVSISDIEIVNIGSQRACVHLTSIFGT